MHTGRIIKVISTLIAMTFAMSGFPVKTLADVINSPTYYFVQSDLSYEITTNITSSWINHESIDLILTNAGNETIHNWYLTFNTPYNIDNIWNGALYETDGDGTYTITSNGWNQDIHAGESVTVGITFSSDTETELSVDPEWYLLNTQATVVDTSQYTLEYTEYSAWETGFTGQLTLAPQVDCQHWELSFGSNREITAVSSAVLISEGENNYAITHDENNMRLFAGNAYNFGIQGVNTEDSLVLSNVELTVVDLAYHLTDDEDANGVPDYLDFIGGGSIVDPTPTPTPVPTDVPTETPTTEPTGTDAPTPTEEPTPTPIIDYEADQDLDGLPDYIENQLGTDPLKADSDDDGLSDYVELLIEYNPVNPDTDGNGISDSEEDYDCDDLSNEYELNSGLNMAMEDTDGDYLNDGDEVNVYGTDPLVPDSDGDGICDGDEVSMGKDPSDPTDGATRISQSLTQEINDAEDPAITSVTVTADLAGKIDRVLDIRDYYNIDVYSTDVYGRIGSPINFECDEEFDLATIVIHYDETQLINTPENSLGVLWYDEENNVYELQEQAVVDTANNQITLEVDHFSTYVLVNTTTWFNPVRPNYYGYFYYPNVIVQADDVQGSYTLQTYEDIAWADFQAEHGENFVRVNTVYSYDYHMNGHYYYLYEWLAIDTTDSDEDGALDFIETLGVLGSNHHTYYSDVGNPDSDGDTLPDGVELGNIYLLGKFTDNNYLEKYRRDVDGTITACQDFHKFDFFRSILFSRSVAAVACIHSDPKMQDSDRDDSIDPFDAFPIIVNPMINYIIVGDEIPEPDKTLRTGVRMYTSLLDESGLEYILIHISNRSEFDYFWEHMKRINHDGSVADADIYSQVDNLIVICHGNPDGMVFGLSDGGLTISLDDMDDLGRTRSARINVVDYHVCYSAYVTEGVSLASLTVSEWSVNEAYGWNGPSSFDPLNNRCGYYYPDLDGYYRYRAYTDTEPLVYRIPVEYTVYDYRDGHFVIAYFYDAVIHSFASLEI